MVGTSHRVQHDLTAHHWPDERNRNYKTFIDVKSESLRDTLRRILADIRTISLHSDSPEVSRLP